VASFEVIRHTHHKVDDAWSRLTDWERHGEFLPFTTVVLTGVIRDEVGAAFLARTSFGPFHFDDPMDVTVWEPPLWERPGRCEIQKRGQVVRGGAILTVTKTDEGSLINWLEDASFRWVGRLLDLPNRIGGRRVFGSLVDGLLSDRMDA
jgi:carbon monoxide dehydrogenase subunit G